MYGTYKASILYYTVINVIALGAHDVETGGPDEGAQRAPGPLAPGLLPPLLGVLVLVIWTAGSHEPRGLVNARLIDLGHTDGVSDPHPS